MDVEKNVGGRDRLVRALLAAVLTVVAIGAIRRGRRKAGLLSGIGALGLGFNAVTCFCGVNETLGIDTTSGETTTEGTTGTGAATGAASEPRDELEADSTGQATRPSGSLTCASCGEPIRPGQRRGPNDGGEIVHDRCA